MRIEYWAVVSNSDEYTAPEQRRHFITGSIYGNPRFPDGHDIRTSYIIAMDALFAYTRNSTYELGEPDPQFVEYLTSHGKDIYHLSIHSQTE